MTRIAFIIVLFAFLFLQTINAQVSVSDSINNRVKNYLVRGEYAKCESYLLDLKSKYESISTPASIFTIAVTNKHFGTLYSPGYLNIPTKSESFYDLAFNQLTELQNISSLPKDFSKLIVEKELINVLNNKANLVESQSRYDEAIMLLKRVLEYDKKNSDSTFLAYSYLNLGRVYRNKAISSEDAKNKATLIEFAIRLFQSSLRVSSLSETWINLARTYEYIDKSDSAEYSYKKAIDESKSRNQLLLEANALLNYGNYLKVKGDSEVGFKNKLNYDEAIVYLKDGLRIIEKVRGTLNSDKLRSAYYDDKVFYQENLIQIYLAQKNYPALLETIEEIKARTFLDQISGKDILAKNGYSDEIKRNYEIVKELSYRIIENADLPDSAKSISKIIRERDSLIAHLTSLAPDLMEFVGAKSLSYKEIMHKLNDSTVIIEYFLGKKCSVAICYDNVKIAAKLLDTEIFNLADSVASLYESIIEFPNEKWKYTQSLSGKSKKGKGNRNNINIDSLWQQKSLDDSFQWQLLNLYGFLVGKEFSEIVSRNAKIVFVPHGVLHHFPFAALISKVQNIDFDNTKHIVRPKYLFEEKLIKIIPSASIYLKLSEKSNPTNGNALVIGDPDYPTNDWNKLVYALQEAKSIAEIMKESKKVSLLTGKDATESFVKENISSFEYLHFGTHGLYQRDAIDSEILFAPTKKDDGFLTVKEIYSLQINAKLLVLSACQSGMVGGYQRGQISHGDDLVGLTRAFLYAGADNIVCSLWSVDDMATGKFMVRFYSDLIKKNMSISNSVRNASLEVLDSKENPDWKHPFYWAPFFITGSN